jgi:YD repeat-containing protein
MRKILLTATALTTAVVLVMTQAKAQQSTIYGADGRVTGHVSRDSGGASTIYGADGRVTGRTATDRQGTTTVYDGSGNRVGSISNGGKR